MVTYAYTLSSVNTLPTWTFLSIKTLIQQVAADDVVVFFTPPRDPDHVEALNALGVDVRCVENHTEAFEAFATEQHYGAKTWVSSIEDDTVVFLDCDTLMFGDIQEAIRGDFEFKARPGTSAVRQPEWRELFDRFDEPYLDWMPNAGFLIFKNRLHQKIGEQWREYVGTELNYQHDVNHKEQYALALAVGGADTVQMNRREHVMLWNDELPADGLVYHAGKSLEPNREDLTAPDTFKGNVFVGLQKLMQGNL